MKSPDWTSHYRRQEYGFASHALKRAALNCLEEAMRRSLELYPPEGAAANATDKVMKRVRVRILIPED